LCDFKNNINRMTMKTLFFLLKLETAKIEMISLVTIDSEKKSS
jgi:hypothetical protein